MQLHSERGRQSNIKNRIEEEETESVMKEFDEEEQTPTSSSSLLINLYVGHFLARWGARMWEFSVGLYMINVWPDSLLLAAAYGVVESASTALFGPFIGQWVNKLSYIQVLRVWLLSQNLSFVVAGGAVITLLTLGDLKSTNYAAFVFLVILINISGAGAVLSTLAGTILVEREWVVVISEGQPQEVLTKMNSIIRRIDLTCTLFAPVVTGFIISFVSLTASAVTLALWNVLSVFLQYWLLMSVYNGIPVLRQISQRRVLSRSSVMEIDEGTLTNQERKSLISSYKNDSKQPLSSSSKGTIIEQFMNLSYISAWRLYIKQDLVVLPGISLALLYFTVLSFGTLMTAALEWQGIPAYVIGIARGISAIVGIAATFLYPFLKSRTSTLQTGHWSIWSQWTCLLLCVASVFVKNKIMSAYILMGGVALSRLGLWMFDLSVIQQMQDHVAESDRCIIGGVQNSLQSLLDLMTNIMGIIISNPQEFWKLTMLSFMLVTIAATLYSMHVYRVRKHLFHFDKLFWIIQRMWEFSVGLYMINVWPDSLLLAAAYGVVESASTALFGPLIGHWVDNLSYIQVLRFWLLTQNLSFMVAGVAVVAILPYANLMSANYTAFISLVLLINISGAIGVLSTLGGTILVEREWVVVISEGQPPEFLTKMNSTIRRIDLTCKLFAPVVSGFIISFVSLTASAVTLALWNVLSVFLQYWLLMSVYNGIPILRHISERRVLPSRSSIIEVDESTSTYYRAEDESSRSKGTITERFLNLPYISAWRLYFKQDVVLPGLSLALLYFTVLSFGTLMSAALEWEGIPAYVIGIGRGISATIGIAATFLYPVLQSRLSTLRTGLWSIWSQWTCLLLCVASVFMKEKLVSAYMLMGGVALSRLGLWMFDLSVIQQMQDHVAESDRCVVGGAQNSLQSVLDLMTYIMGIIISNPQEFWKLTMLSFLLVTIAAILYSVHIYRVRKHLFHFDKFIALLQWSVISS